jgi:replicative DNA helicase
LTSLGLPTARLSAYRVECARGRPNAPQNLEAESNVLGSILLDNEVYAQIEGSLVPEGFCKEGHGKIDQAMERLAREGCKPAKEASMS